MTTGTESPETQALGTPATLLARHAADPDLVFAVVEDGGPGDATVVTYAHELSRATATAGALAGLGVRAGDRVHVHTANCLEFFDAWFATALLGAVLLPTGPQATVEELRYVLEQAGPVVSLVAPGLHEKDMIKRSGENVSAGEIERVAADHPAVAECAAIGVPDPVRDEAIVLVAVPTPGHAPRPDELIAWCADRLAPYKVPGSVVFADALPRTGLGKIAKAQLRARLLAAVPESLKTTHQEET